MMGLMQLLDRAGVLYGELARFALRLLGYKVPDRPKAPPEGGGAPGTGMGMGPGGYGMGGVYGGGMNSGYGYGASPGYGGGGFESAWGGA
jgi:peroxin-13